MPSRRHGVARVISKWGLGSRTEAARWVAEGRVRVNGTLVHDPEYPVIQGRDEVRVDDLPATVPDRRVVMLHKPAGLVTTARDERGRDTVYRCFAGSGLPWLSPVGRLDKASEGLLLFTNDPAWGATITRPYTGPHKTYHVQIDRACEPALLARLEAGLQVTGEFLCAAQARCLHSRSGGLDHDHDIHSAAGPAWLEVVLDEGRNRHIRRLLGAAGIGVLRLVRVSLGPLLLGDLKPGSWRLLDPHEIEALGPRPVAGIPATS